MLFSESVTNVADSIEPIQPIQPFYISDDMCLFFDIFYKKNKIHLILPIYNDVFNSEDIKIKCNDTFIQITDKHIKNSYEPTCIYIYNYVSDLEQIDVNIEYKNIIKTFKLKHINDAVIRKELTLTTLFKDDCYLFPLFYKYYKEQGVSHFYMYYNGKITPEINEMFKFDDVTLIEWDYKYWNDQKYKYYHHAQLGQIHHAIYRYGKNECNYMIFCDLDEYLHVPNNNINRFISDNKEIDVFGFCNKWSNTIDNILPPVFPCEFLTADRINYGTRSKNIYKIETIKTIAIHTGNSYNKSPKAIINLSMFHFYNWTTVDREITDVPFSLISLPPFSESRKK